MSQLFSLEAVYVLTGLLLLCFAALTLRDDTHSQRIGSALFWALLGVIFALGGVLPHWVTGVLVLLLVVLDGAGQVGKSEDEAAPAQSIGQCSSPTRYPLIHGYGLCRCGKSGQKFSPGCRVGCQCRCL